MPLCLALLGLLTLQSVLSEGEHCQTQVVVTTPTQLTKQIRDEVTDAFESFTNASCRLREGQDTHTATGGPYEQNTPTDRPDEDGTRQGPDIAIAIRIENKLDAIKQGLDALSNRINILEGLGLISSNAADSCAQILRTNLASPSGYYWVANSTGYPHSVYCDMNRSCGGVAGGWMRVAYLDMTNSSHRCPSGLRQRRDSGVRSCTAASNNPTCSSVHYSTNGMQYSRVCGKIHGLQVESIDGFATHGSARGSTLNSNYVDGVSLTHGQTSGRQHIWSFAGGSCGNNISPPTFVGNDYFEDGSFGTNIILNNPLWDGVGCGSNTCCRRNNPPWFHKQLPRPTTDNIEMRVCRDEPKSNEDIPVQVVEIYIR